MTRDQHIQALAKGEVTEVRGDTYTVKAAKQPHHPNNAPFLDREGRAQVCSRCAAALTIASRGPRPTGRPGLPAESYEDLQRQIAQLTAENKRLKAACGAVKP